MSDDRHNELMSELTVGLADLVSAIERNGGADTDKIVAAIVQGLKGAMPQVNLPAPVVNNQINLPQQKGAKWKCTIPGENGAPDRIMYVERLN